MLLFYCLSSALLRRRRRTGRGVYGEQILGRRGRDERGRGVGDAPPSGDEADSQAFGVCAPQQSRETVLIDGRRAQVHVDAGKPRTTRAQSVATAYAHGRSDACRARSDGGVGNAPARLARSPLKSATTRVYQKMIPLLPPIAYLRADDFTPEGRLKIDVSTKPAFVMFHTDSCPHCEDMKPIFQKAANNARRTQFLAVLLDGTDPGERALMARPRGGGPALIEKIAPNLTGVPMLVLYTRHGRVQYDVGGRESIEEFLTRNGALDGDGARAVQRRGGAR
jgi:thiol-disulfide isomerase/thioredoxin